MLARRLAETVGMAMIGDAVVAMLWPGRHARLWEFGPKPYRDLIEAAGRNPGATRVVAAAELGLGLWLVRRQLEGIAPPPTRH